MNVSVSRVSRHSSRSAQERIRTRGRELKGTCTRAHEHTSTPVHQHMSTWAHKYVSTLSRSKRMIARGDASHVERFLCECLCLFPKKNERFVLVHSGRRCTNSFMFVFAFCFNGPVMCRFICSLLFITSIGSLCKTRWQRERHQTNDLISKTTAVHVVILSTFLCRPL